MGKKFLVITGILGMLAVLLGAFGAHYLKSILTPAELTVYETGVRYHFYHTIALLGVAVLCRISKNKRLRYAGWLFFAGVIAFSGSLYLLACKEVLGIGAMTKVLGPITPIGGLLFAAGWVFLTLTGLSSQKSST